MVRLSDSSQEIWTKRFDAPVGTAVLADLDGDSKSEIVVSVGDGNIYYMLEK